MVTKKITIRNSGSSLTGLVMILLIVMGIFFGAYFYVAENINSAGLTLDSKYSESYENLSAAQADLEANVKTIQGNIDAIKESEGVINTAWNGLKGLGNTLKLPINFVDTALVAYTATTSSLDILPFWVLPLLEIGILAFIVFLILKILKGEPAV